MRFAQHGLAHRRRAPAVWYRALPGGCGRCGQMPGRGDVGGAHSQLGQPGEAAAAYAGAVVVDGPGASLGPAHLPAQQPVPGGQMQDPRRGIPPRLFQQAAVEHRGQARGCAVQEDPLEHMRELPGSPGGRLRPGQCRGGHRSSPARSRGLGTASTAARSREEPGCTYT